MPDTAFSNIDYKNTTKAVPKPDNINDIDVEGNFYDNILDASINGTLDLTSISSFSNVSRSRDQLYSMIDVMCEDPMISSALNIYASESCEPNDHGQVVWAESDDENTQGMVTYLLEQLSIDKNSFGWVLSMIKYGDLYLRLVRKSEFEDDLFSEDKKRSTLNEDIIMKRYKDSDRYADYLEVRKNPAEVFELQKYGKTAGYICTHVQSQYRNNDDLTNITNNTNYQYNFDQSDIDLYQATDFVHAYLEDNQGRSTETVSITNGDEKSYIYNVRRGQSLLANKFRIWRELSLLENAVMLNRITRSSVIRIAKVEVGDMEKSDVRALLHRIKSMVEQKVSIGVGQTYEDYTNPGPMENTIYIPTHGEKGSVSFDSIGGDVQSDPMHDVDYFKRKLLAGLGIPGAYLGEGDDDGSLFNNGNSLSLKSSQFAKTVKRIQNSYLQAITDAVNLLLLDRGLHEYIGNFTLRMQSPTTQEEKDRKDAMNSTITNIESTMRLFQDTVQDPKAKLVMLKSLLTGVITDSTVLSVIQEQIDKLDEAPEAAPVSEGLGGFDNGLGGFDAGLEGGYDAGLEGDIFSEPPANNEIVNFDTSSIEIPSSPMTPMSAGPEVAQESLEVPDIDEEVESIDESEQLPTWSDLNMNYDGSSSN